MTPSDEGSSFVADLVAWAKGSYPTEAATQLLISAFDGHFARPGWPWIGRTESGRYYLDATKLTDDDIGMLSGGEQRTLAIVRSLLGAQPVDLADALTGLDVPTSRTVLKALTHATGAHEQTEGTAALLARIERARTVSRQSPQRSIGFDSCR